MRHIILISGKDSLSTAIVQKAKEPTFDYEYIFNPTGAELPEVDKWLAKVEIYLDAKIERVGADLLGIIKGYNFLPSSRARYCTRQSKIEPLEKFLKGSDATVYYGLRYDEPERVGYDNSKNQSITPDYPLRDAKMTIAMVWALLGRLDLLPPQFIWHDMIARVRALMADNSGIIDTLHPWELAPLFGWRTRPNCYFCFFQRQYEFIGLFEHHPDLFWKAVELEENTGAEGYTLQSGYSLRSLLPRADEIKERRAKAIAKMLYSLAQKPLFLDGDGEYGDELAVNSCGLYCGK